MARSAIDRLVLAALLLIGVDTDMETAAAIAMLVTAGVDTWLRTRERQAAADAVRRALALPPDCDPCADESLSTLIRRSGLRSLE